jgi:polysaccharide biosynthesis protein PslH
MNILFLSGWFPYPPANGSKLRIYNLLRKLAEHHKVTLITFADQPEETLDLATLRSFCQEVHVARWAAFQPDSAQARLNFLSPKPRWLITAYSPQMEALIREAVATDHYDVVIASQINLAFYRYCFAHLPAIFEEVEVGSMYEQYAYAPSTWQRLRYGLTWIKHRQYLSTLLRQYDICTVASEQERHLIKQAVIGDCRIEVIPNCVDVASYADVNEDVKPNSLIFTGAFTYAPNYEGMRWFLSKVFPLVQAEIPDVHLTITGNHADLPLPPNDAVTRTGFVDDVRPLIARAYASVVPLHTGGGTRLKILEAMALGTPVVATSKGAEGLDAQGNVHLLVADQPDVMAQAVVRLLREPGLRQRLADQAYHLVKEQYDWSRMMPRFLDLVEQVARIRD